MEQKKASKPNQHNYSYTTWIHLQCFSCTFLWSSNNLKMN